MYLYDVCFFFFYCSVRILIRPKMNKDCYYNKTVNFLLKSKIRGPLVETPEVFSVLRVWQGFSLIRLKFVVSRLDYLRYHVGSFPVRS